MNAKPPCYSSPEPEVFLQSEKDKLSLFYLMSSIQCSGLDSACANCVPKDILSTVCFRDVLSKTFVPFYIMPGVYNIPAYRYITLCLQ